MLMMMSMEGKKERGNDEIKDLELYYANSSSSSWFYFSSVDFDM